MNLLKPIAKKRRQEMATKDLEWEEPNDFLQWMIRDGRGDEVVTENVVYRQLMVALASIHTTSMSLTHFMYDLCTYPEHLAELLQELVNTLREDSGFKKTTLNKMRKLDSFLKESMRMHPHRSVS